MNNKLHREDYYNDEYPLNPQEEKEFLMPVQDPYWLIRGRAYLLEIPIFGNKSTIKRNIEILLFNLNSSELEKSIPTQNEAKIKASVDLFEKKFGKSEINYAEAMEINGFQDYLQNLPGYKKQISPIYSHIPELKLMKKTLTYAEIYTAISRLSDPQMVFINMFKENPRENLVSGIIYLPYTPVILEHENCSSDFILKIANYLGLHCNYNVSFETEKIKILKQKLLDIFYLVDDSDDLHGITPCHSINSCRNLASIFCENNLCKLCCEKMTNKEFCVLHDDMVNFYRKKMNEILEFEHRKNFDRSKTVRISIRQRISKNELKNIFEEVSGTEQFSLTGNQYNIDWDNIELLFRKGVDKIQFIYLQCASNQDARRLYEDRGKIMKKWEKLEINIQSLMENIEDILIRVNSSNFSSSGLLVVPTSTVISNSKKIPKKSQRNQIFTEMIQKIMQIPSSEFKLINCNNNINNEFSYDYYFIEFPSKEQCDKFYSLQPFLDSIIFHKLSHLRFFPLLVSLKQTSFIGGNISKCINCEDISDPSCIFELCNSCCSKQKKDGLIISKIKIHCQCANKVNMNLKLDSNSNFICIVCKEADPNKFESKCYGSTNLCENCCKLQLSPLKICVFHNNLIKNSFYFAQQNFSYGIFDFNQFINDYQINLSQVKLKLIFALKNGDFHWFRPVENTNLTRLMLDMNKELMIIMDNPNFRREGPLRIHDKMYKIFTYQHENMLKKVYDSQKTKSLVSQTVEGFDFNGDFFVEYDFDHLRGGIEYQPENYVPTSQDRLESLDIKNNELDISELADKIKESFHFIIYGLDAERFSTTDLIEEIYQEFKNSFGKMNKEDICLLDEQSVLSYVYSNISNFTAYEKFITYGRFATVKLKTEKDALKLFLEKTKVNLPLSNGKKGMPYLYPGGLFKSYLEKNK